MERKLRLFFTSDIHGYFSPVDYATGKSAFTGLANCMTSFTDDGNTLILDGGDTLQGSPLTYFLHKNGMETDQLPAKVMNIAGYHFYTLGNHDFNYGLNYLQGYIDEMHAQCLCANVEGLRGIYKTAVVTMKNGLKVGLTGITTDFIKVWEKPENLKGITLTDPIAAARRAYEELESQNVDLTICIYHGGFENDIQTGKRLSETLENQAYRICQELSFDVLLTGHQHIAMPGSKLNNTFICQTPDKAKKFISGEITVSESGISGSLKLMDAGNVTDKEAWTLLAPYEKKATRWMDEPVGHLDRELLPKDHLDMAANGSLIANFFNQVQLDASGAEISIASLANEVKGFNKDVTIRDVVATYIYPNTLATLALSGDDIRKIIERSAEYFTMENGSLAISETFLKPKVEHYNYQYVSGVYAAVDIRRPVGDRVVSLSFNGKELEPDREYMVCMNNYLSTGTGGYKFLKKCRKVKEETSEIAEIIMEYISTRSAIQVDTEQYLKVLY